jgi:hypothetical protein
MLWIRQEPERDEKGNAMNGIKAHKKMIKKEIVGLYKLSCVFKRNFLLTKGFCNSYFYTGCVK